MRIRSSSPPLSTRQMGLAHHSQACVHRAPGLPNLPMACGQLTDRLPAGVGPARRRRGGAPGGGRGFGRGRDRAAWAPVGHLLTPKPEGPSLCRSRPLGGDPSASQPEVGNCGGGPPERRTAHRIVSVSSTSLSRRTLPRVQMTQESFTCT